MTVGEPNPPAGDYEVTLLTREAFFSAAGQRVMSVSAEGTQFIKDLDIYRTVKGPRP